jgi:hypothetical protein
MAQFRWVNHNQTARQEIDGQHLWFPKNESNGARSEFYSNMRRATAGDLVLSYADQAIRHIGMMPEFAFTASKPMAFGETGAYWNQVEWLLPIFWTPLSLVIAGATFGHEALSHGGSNSPTFEVINELLDDIVGRIADDDPLEGTTTRACVIPRTLSGNTN